MLRVSLVTTLTRETRLKFVLNRTRFGEVTRAGSHDIGARNAIEFLFEVDKVLAGGVHSIVRRLRTNPPPPPPPQRNQPALFVLAFSQ